MCNTPDAPAKKPDDRMNQGGNYWTLFTPGIWKVLHAVFQREDLIDPFQVAGAPIQERLLQWRLPKACRKSDRYGEDSDGLTVQSRDKFAVDIAPRKVVWPPLVLAVRTVEVLEDIQALLAMQLCQAGHGSLALCLRSVI
jgi:hypothetical protein